MACPFDRGLLTAYFDGEATPAEREEVDRHLASCADCRRELVDLRAAVTRVKSLPRVKAPPGLALHVSAEISSAPRVGGAGRIRWFQAAAGVAAALLVAASVMILVKRPFVDESPTAVSVPAARSLARESAAPRSPRPDESELRARSSSLDQKKFEEDRRLSPAPVPRADEFQKMSPEGRAGAGSREEGTSDNLPATQAEEPESVPGADKEKAQAAPPQARPVAEATGVDEPRVLQISGKPVAQAVASMIKHLRKTERSAAPTAQFGASDFARTHYLEVEVTDAELEELMKALRESGLAVAPGSLEAERRRVAPHDPDMTASVARAARKVTSSSAPAQRAPEAGRGPAAESKAKAKSDAEADGPVRRVVIFAFLDPEPTK